MRAFPPGKDQWKTRFVSLMSYVLGIFYLVPLMSASLIDDYMTAPIPLEKMRKTTGVLVSVTSCFRCPYAFTVRLKSGEMIEFPDTIFSLLKLRGYIGTEITVWSQVGFFHQTNQGYKLFHDKSYEVLIHKSGQFVYEYQAKRGEWIARYEKAHWWSLGFLLLGIWLPFRVLWKHRKPA